MPRRKAAHDLRRTRFNWYRDAAGYDLAGDGIRRRGGAMMKYEPDTISPPIHREFIGLKRTPAALLDFIQKYGFLGSVHGGADAAEERLGWLLEQHDRFKFFYMLSYDVRDTKQTRAAHAAAAAR